METAIEARGIQQRFGLFKKACALRDFDLALPYNRVTVILGRNGAGKSTFLKLAQGLMKATSGTLRTLGLDPIAQDEELRQRSGYVPDLADAPGWMTLPEWLDFLAPHYRRFDPARAFALAETFRVPLDRSFKQMSRGQQMLAMLGSAVAHEPELLLLDEPFAALDPVAREDVLRALITELHTEGEAGRTVVLTTHDLEIACRVADEIVVIDGGRVTWQESVGENDETRPRELAEQLKNVLAGSEVMA